MVKVQDPQIYPYLVCIPGLVTVTITGPGIPSSYVLTLNVNLAYNPVLTVNVNGTTYTLTNSSSDAQSHVTGTSIPVSFSLSNAVPNSSYTVQKQIQYQTSSGVLVGPSTQFTVTTDSSGNASWSIQLILRLVTAQQ